MGEESKKETLIVRIDADLKAWALANGGSELVRQLLQERRFEVTPAYQELFTAAMKAHRMRHGEDFDAEFGSALYILTGHEGLWGVASKYVGTGIQFDEILRRAHSSGEKVLVRLAGNLFGAGMEVSPIEFFSLSERSRRIAMTAIEIRFGRVSLPSFDD